MAQFRLSRAARADLARILATSLERWGEAGRARYQAVVATALQTVARAPDGPTTRDRSELSPGLRSFHLQHARRGQRVDEPVHVIYFRATASTIEIVRVLHERMDPGRHLEPARSRRR